MRVSACVVSLVGRDTLADLILLGPMEFDAILGMDWLASCHASLDYHLKRVYFDLPGEDLFYIQGDRTRGASRLISAMQARRMLGRGCEGFLAVVRECGQSVREVSGVPVVCEFPDVFPDELPGLPPDREIKLCIDLVLKAQPISIPI